MAALDLPELPDGVQELWQTFNEMSAARGVGAFATAPLTYPDIVAYQIAWRIRFTPWELRCLKALDAEWIAYAAQQAKAKSNVSR